MNSCPPILLIVFNRPHLAATVLDAIGKQRPSKLYIAADAPRDPALHPNDAYRCEECRNLAHTIDWPCEVLTKFSAINQGCGLAVSSAISWFFEHEKSGIILEDDCLPADDFFPYCAELLQLYQDKKEVMAICGNIFGAPQSAQACAGYSYGFGRYAQVWGWATWARAWSLYHYEIGGSADDFRYFKTRGVSYLQQKLHQERVKSTNDPGGPNTWDYQWQFAVLKNEGLAICPSVNLISNLGFGNDATHTLNANSENARAPIGKLSFPLKHPNTMKDAPSINKIYADHMLGPANRHRKKLYKSYLRKLFRIGIINK